MTKRDVEWSVSGYGKDALALVYRRKGEEDLGFMVLEAEGVEDAKVEVEALFDQERMSNYDFIGIVTITKVNEIDMAKATELERDEMKTHLESDERAEYKRLCEKYGMMPA